MSWRLTKSKAYGSQTPLPHRDDRPRLEPTLAQDVMSFEFLRI